MASLTIIALAAVVFTLTTPALGKGEIERAGVDDELQTLLLKGRAEHHFLTVTVMPQTKESASEGLVDKIIEVPSLLLPTH